MLGDVSLNQITLCAGKLWTVSEEGFYLHRISTLTCDKSVIEINPVLKQACSGFAVSTTHAAAACPCL
jgi:hypothetical protein